MVLAPPCRDACAHPVPQNAPCRSRDPASMSDRVCTGQRRLQPAHLGTNTASVTTSSSTRRPGWVRLCDVASETPRESVGDPTVERGEEMAYVSTSTGRSSTTPTRGADGQSCSAMVGRCAQTPGRSSSSCSQTPATGRSPMIDAATAGRSRPIPAMTWKPTRGTSPT